MANLTSVRVKTLTNAMQAGRYVALTYRDAKGRKTDRVIEPKRIYESNDGDLVVYAKCHLRGDFREFRLDRMVRCRQDDEIDQDLPEGKVEVNPTQRRLCKVPPQVVPEESAREKYVPAGWVIGPVLQIIRH